MNFTLELSKQELLWLRHHVGEFSGKPYPDNNIVGDQLGISVNLYKKLSKFTDKVYHVLYLHKEADKYQTKMFNLRQQAAALEAELENKNAGAPVQGTG